MNETLHPTTSRATDVLAEIRDSALWLTINRESVRNALNDSVLDTLADHIRGVSRHPEVRVIAELCFTGEPISARQALQVGLLNDVVPTSELDTRVAALLASVVKNSPTAIRRGKYALRATLDMTIEQALAYMETQLGTLS